MINDKLKEAELKVDLPDRSSLLQYILTKNCVII